MTIEAFHHSGQVRRQGQHPSLAFSPDGKRIASVGRINKNHILRIWQLSDGTLQHEIECGEYTPLLMFSSDSQQVTTVSMAPEGPYIRKWDIANEKLLSKNVVKMDHALPLMFSHDLNTFILERAIETGTGYDHTFEIRNTYTGTRILEIPLPDKNRIYSSSPVNPLDTTADGKWLALKLGYLVYVWQLPSGELCYTIRSPRYPETVRPNSLTFSPDGKWLAICERDKLHIWRTSDGQCETTLLPMNGHFDRMLFSPHGKWLACAGMTGLEIFRTSVEPDKDKEVTK